MQTCQLCGHEHERFGQLIDPNGHKWRICADCINTLWDKRQATTLEALAEEQAIDWVLDKLRSLLNAD